MKRVLVASTVVLAAALAFLVWQKLSAKPAPPPAAAAEAQPVAPVQPHDATPAQPAVEPPKPEPKPEPAAAPAVAPPKAQVAKAAPMPEPRAKTGRPQPAAPDAAAAAAIFSDRPATSDGGAAEAGHGKTTPRLPVLRKPSAGVAPPSYAAAAAAAAAAAVPRRDPSPRPPAAGHGAARASAARASATAPAAAATAAPPPPASAAAAAPLLPGAVSGTVRGAAGAPITGTTVLAVAASGDEAFETVTDDEGFYLLAAMRPGRYLLFAGLGGRPGSALPARSVEVANGQVARVDLREPAGGATVRVRPLTADGAPARGQVLLVAGRIATPATLPSLLASDAIFLPEPGAPNVLRRVPAGVYTVVILQGAGSPPRVARQPVTVRGEGEQQLELRLPADFAVAPAPARG